MREFTLPDLGEGLEEAEIVAWYVTEGDHVVADQPLLSVETDKAVVEIPSPRSGSISKLHSRPGEIVKVGATLVEFGVGEDVDSGAIVGELVPSDGADHDDVNAGETRRLATARPQVSPAVRALARKLEVDVAALTGTGPDGVATRDDVERAARQVQALGEGQALRGMRRAMAERMTDAHSQVVPAGVCDDADTGDWREGEDVTVRLVRAIAVASSTEPALNAWYFAQSGVRHLVERVDVGIAVDTPAGLIVPVLRNVAVRDAGDLRRGLDRMQADAAARVVPPDELRGATITLSNFGIFGGRYAHLMIVPPQVAIIGAGRADDRAVVREGRVVVRRQLPLTLIFDHRVVTGGEGARFMQALKADLEKSS